MREEGDLPPEIYLTSLRKEEKKTGKLKIFLGMSAGVGKTYAMLETAQQRAKEGSDVVVGVINTHNRPETSRLLEGLSIIPLKKIEYKNTTLEELDLDALLKRKPQLALIDELAHTNIPGSRHPKRWQDIIEILDAGIDVFTTLNVQHIESRKDLVEKITGITIRETVPDVIIEQADRIRLVDVTPQTLLLRLKEGKVYLGEQSAIAARNFFLIENLTALRELALRVVAEKVEHELHGIIAIKEHPEGWKLVERLLVLVDEKIEMQQLLRATARLASSLNAPWIALYVDKGEILEKEDHENLLKNLDFARDLGAEAITTTDADVLKAIKRIVRQNAITQIILGTSKRGFFSRIFRPKSLAEKLSEEIEDIDVHIVRQDFITGKRRVKKKIQFLPKSLLPYLSVTFFIAILTAISFSIAYLIGYRSVGLIYLFGVLLLSLFFSRGPVLYGAFLSAFSWNFFFINPFRFEMSSYEDILLMSIYLFIALITGILTTRVKRHETMLLKREESNQAIYEIVREISKERSLEKILSYIKTRLNGILNGQCEIILKDKDNNLVFDKAKFFLKNEKERTVAIWAFENGKEAGWSTDTLPSAGNLYIPLKGFREHVGVFVYHPLLPITLTSDQTNLLYTIVRQLTLFIENSMVKERKLKNEQFKETEKIYMNILGAISNEFRDPVNIANEEVKFLKSTFEGSKNEKQHLLNLEKATKRFKHMVENVFYMSKLSAESVKSFMAFHTISEIVTETLKNIEEFRNGDIIKVSIQEDFPSIKCDFTLIVILLTNLIYNAIDFSPKESIIQLEAAYDNQNAYISVIDQGPGIPTEIQKIIFEKFYRSHESTMSGIGLGLSVAKSVVHVHGGEIKIQNMDQGGTKFTVILPLDPILSNVRVK